MESRDAPVPALSEALLERARASLGALVADGRWSSARDAELDAAFERAATAALARRQPAERSIALRRLARVVPKGFRPILARAARAVDRRIAARSQR